MIGTLAPCYENEPRHEEALRIWESIIVGRDVAIIKMYFSHPCSAVISLTSRSRGPSQSGAPPQLFVGIINQKYYLFDMPNNCTYNTRVREVWYAEKINNNSR